MALQKKKKELRQELSAIEKQIFDLERQYLEETKDFGNIFTGWDAYLSADKSKAKKTINTEDRIFSLSSVTSPASRREEDRKYSNTISMQDKLPLPILISLFNASARSRVLVVMPITNFYFLS